jgi:deoxyadenosine/deoxycytidine kinase
MTVEIIGPPGSGKSALTDALRDSRRDIVPVSIYWRKPENLSLGARSALSVAPILFDHASGQAFSTKHLVWMIRLESALPIFQRKEVTRSSIVVFDQGPVFTMVRLYEMALLAAEGSRFRSWWNLKLDDWARTLDLLLLLDAPNEVLIERIKKRSKSHVAKNQSDEGAGKMLTDERARYEAVTGALRQRGSATLLPFDTSARSVDEISSEVIGSLRSTNLSKEDFEC